ncbi:NBPF family member NBPF8 isoform X1 [Macaca mulatta]
MQKLPHSVHQEQPHTVWADRKSCQIQQADDFRDMSMGYRTPVITTTMKLGFGKEPLKIRMVKQNNIIPGEIQILLRFTGWESKVNVKKQPPVGIKCEPMDQGAYSDTESFLKDATSSFSRADMGPLFFSLI